jgi:phage major head subunit gpT-like protein
MDITPTSIQGFFTGFSVRFSELFARTSTWWQDVATLHPASSELEKIAWQGRIPAFREWIGPRTVHGVAAEGYQVLIPPRELTVGIDKFKLDDDTYGVYSTTAAQFGMQAKKLPDYLMVTALKSGGDSALGLCPDGLSFWNNAHPVDVYSTRYSTYDNDFDLTLTPDNYQTVRQSMAVRLGQDGKPLNVHATELWVPPALEATGKQILEADLIANNTFQGATQAGGYSNIWKGTAKLRVVPELATGSDDLDGVGDKTWYMFDTSKVVKPLLYVLREAAVITYRTAPTDPVVFDTHQYLYGGVERSNYGYALPFLASRSVGT